MTDYQMTDYQMTDYQMTDYQMTDGAGCSQNIGNTYGSEHGLHMPWMAETNMDRINRIDGWGSASPRVGFV